MKILSIIVFIIILTIGLYLKSHKEKYRTNAICEMYEEFVKKDMSGIIQKKFKDENHHLNETIIVNNEKIDIGLDKSSFYDFVVYGDSIIKIGGDAKVDVFREGKKLRSFLIDFGCIMKD